MDKDDAIFGLGCFTILVPFILWLAFWLGVIYVAWHFISKLW